MIKIIYNVLATYATHAPTIVSSFSTQEEAVEEFEWCCKCAEQNICLAETKNTIVNHPCFKIVEYSTPLKDIVSIQLTRSVLVLEDNE